MIPTQARLIEGIRRSLVTLQAPTRSKEDQQLAASIQIALGELQLRQDEAFLHGHLARGQDLERRAVALGTTAAKTAAGEEEHDRLLRSLTDAVARLAPREQQNGEIKALLNQIVDWENALHARRVQGAQPQIPPEEESPYTAERIGHYIAKKFPERKDVLVTNVRNLSGGFSKVTVMFDVNDAAQRAESLVIRAEQPLSIMFLEGRDVRNEFPVLKAASRAGIPVAEPLWLEEDESFFGSRFLVSRRSAGRNFGSRIGVNETITEALLRDVVQRLVQIHALPVTDPDIARSHLGAWARHTTLSDCTAATIAYWKKHSANFGLAPSPILTRALAWLEQNVPQENTVPSVLHGDYGLHNLLISDDDRVSCILDWEACSYGDPADEVVWLAEGLKGSIERQRIVDLYHELGGRPVSPQRLKYFDVLNCVRFAVTCPRAAFLFQQNLRIGIEACQLGLLYTYFGTSGLTESIRQAEALR